MGVELIFAGSGLNKITRVRRIRDTENRDILSTGSNRPEQFTTAQVCIEKDKRNRLSGDVPEASIRVGKRGKRIPGT
jgi:hypothetical protein